MKTDELKFKKFEEECRRYLYEKEALLQLEKRFVKVNTSNTHYNDNCSRYDPLKKYRFLPSQLFLQQLLLPFGFVLCLFGMAIY